MPTTPKKANNITPETTAQALNIIGQSMTGFSLPKALTEGETVTDENGVSHVVTKNEALLSLRGIGNYLEMFEPAQNAFLSALVNRIARVVITSRLYRNPWTGFKKGLLELGETVEEIFVEMAKPYQYNPEKDAETVFKRYIPDVKSAFHSMNFQKYYPTTVNRDQLRMAFLSWAGISDLVARIIEQIYTGANYDEFITMKYMIARLALNGFIRAVNIPQVTAENARTVTSTMVAYARNMAFMNNKNNFAGVRTYTDPNYLYMILTTEISSIFDVEVLALSFNMDKAELLGRQVYVDGFGEVDTVRLGELFQEDDPYTKYVPFTTAELETLSTIQGLMCDESFFMIFDNMYEMTEIYNPKTLEWNYFYHVWKTFSASPYANAILFTTGTPAVTAVTVTPATATVNAGQSIQFTANVTSASFADKGVVWTITGSDGNSTINNQGLLMVGTGETATSLTVKATSLFNSQVSGSATVTVTPNSET